MPNVKGSFSVRAGVNTDTSQWTGGFYYRGRGITTSGVSVTGSNQDVSIGFDESRVSSTYQDNAPVQQRATQMYLYFYVGQFSQTATEQTAGLNTELFNGKADTTLSNLSTEGKSFASGLCMPSNRYIDLTIGAQGATYIAPANGFWAISGHTTNATGQFYGYIQILTENDVMIGAIPLGAYSYFTGGGLVPASKGQKMKIAWRENNVIIDF